LLIEKEKFVSLWQTTLKPVVEADGTTGLHGSPMQDIEECWTILKRLDENQPPPLRTIIELGVCQGGGLKVWEQILPQSKDSLLIGVDWGPNIFWDYKNSPVDIRIVRGNTHDAGVRAEVKGILQERGRQADFLFIDAQHWPKDVEADFVDYGGFVRDNGIIGFHDVRLWRSFWDKFTGGMIDVAAQYETDPEQNRNERAVFHKEEIKISTGAGIFWKIPNQTVIKFREV
jgi:hypothetical protein